MDGNKETIHALVIRRAVEIARNDLRLLPESIISTIIGPEILFSPAGELWPSEILSM
jgi:hypothetical protein